MSLNIKEIVIKRDRGGIGMSKLNSKLKLYGYDLLGDKGEEGIRYAWRYGENKYLLESAAFTEKTKGIEQNICGYTTSVSMGCILKALGRQCKFCRTGKFLPFSNMLTSIDIAKQNILMVLTDINCSDHEKIRNSKREFAYMGQGEPGYSYTQLRIAIKLTNIVMKILKQDVYRHIISTSGILEMIEGYKKDIKMGYFESKVTLHYSLHAALNRNDIMPINHIYPYQSVLSELSDIYTLTGEKPCIGIILFKNFSCDNKSYSNDIDAINNILNEIDPEVFRISLCEFNNSGDLGKSDSFTKEECEEMLNIAKNKGFEAKLFSSFGKKEVAACGMLGGKEPANKIKNKWIELEKYADELIQQAIEILKKDEN